MKIIPLFFLLMFVVFAALQWNDPDPVRWMLSYLAAAFLSFLAYKGRLKRQLAFLAAILFAAAAIYQFPPHYDGVIGNMDTNQNIELARESLGLFICTFLTMVNFFISRKISASQ
ncbi:MAG: transmembrane 220 family protein [Bacteroidia bacterium]